MPVDLSEASGSAVRRSAELAQLFGAALILCHVVPDELYPEGMGFNTPTAKDHAKSLEQRLEEIATKEVPAEVPREAHVWTGTPSATILHGAKEHGVDLIVMPTHGRKGVSHLFLGSTTEKVIRGAACEVLVLRYQPTAS